LVDLQWQIQNLNQMQMPRLLGLYHYKVHFRGFEGTREDLLAIREAETGEAAMYEGADLATVSKAIRLMASDSRENQYRGTRTLLDEPGDCDSAAIREAVARTGDREIRPGTFQQGGA
jgi:hypothetical protein